MRAREETEKLRNEGIKVKLDLLDRNISKNLDYADKLKIPYVIIIGEDELKQKKLKLKNMKTGNEKLVKIEEIKKLL